MNAPTAPECTPRCNGLLPDMARVARRIQELLLRGLLVVLLAEDALAFAILRLLDLRALLGRYLAVSHRLVFHFLDALLAFLEARRFLLVQLARFHALVNALLLLLLALVDARRAGGLREHRKRE